MTFKLDETDVNILKYLQENSRMTTKVIAEKLNLSTTPVFERIKKLEKGGYINRYVALLDEKAIGLKQVIFISISLKEHTRSYLEKFVDEINQYPEILECYHVAGDFDFLLKLIVADVEAYEKFILTRLSTISSIGKVQTHIALSKKKHTTALDLSGLKT